jgi:hypothetical protein
MENVMLSIDMSIGGEVRPSKQRGPRIDVVTNRAPDLMSLEWEKRLAGRSAPVDLLWLRD